MIANQQLSTVIIRLDHRQAQVPRIVVAQENMDARSPSLGAQRPPPSYEDSQMITAIRQKTLRRRASALSTISCIEIADSGSTHVRQTSNTDVPLSQLTAVSDGDSKELITAPDTRDSVIKSQQPEEISDRIEVKAQDLSAPPTLGRARSRRWLKAHCT